MLDEYRNGFYSPAANLAERVRGWRGKAAVNLARWRKLVQSRWPGVGLEPRGDADARVAVATNGIPAESIAVEAELADGARLRLGLVAGNHERAEFAFERAPDAAVRAWRAWPEHDLLAHPYELGLLLWVDAEAARGPAEDS